MLSPEEERIVEEVLQGLARAGEVRAAEMSVLLSRLPGRPEVYDRLQNLALQKELPWLERFIHDLRVRAPAPPAGNGCAPAPPAGTAIGRLSALIESDETYPRKVEALLAALRGGTPGLADLARRRLPVESDPFVQATLASVLGHCGGPDDEERLVELLDSSDGRVVANALEALYRLKIPVDSGRIGALVGSPVNRIRANALALLGLVDADGAMERIVPLTRAPEPRTRVGVAHLLGEQAEGSKAAGLLLEMLAEEQNVEVLKQIAQSLQKLAMIVGARALVGPLHALRAGAAGARRSLLDMLLKQVGIEAGLVESQIEELGRAHQAGRPAPTPVGAVPPLPAPAGSSGPVPAAARAAESRDRAALPSAAPVEDPAPARPSPAPAPSAARHPSESSPAAVPPSSGTAGAPAAGPGPSAGDLEEAAEEDEPLSFAAVWGAPAPAPAAAAIATTRRITLDGLRSSGPVPAARPVARPAPGLLVAIGVGLAGTIGACVMLIGSGRDAAPSTGPAMAHAGSARPVRPDRPGPSSRPAPAGRRPVAPGSDSDLPASLGPAGAPVALDGKVVGVSFGRTVVECQGQHFMVVRGAVTEDLRRGDPIRLDGKLLGRSRDGIFYVEVTRP